MNAIKMAVVVVLSIFIGMQTVFTVGKLDTLGVQLLLSSSVQISIAVFIIWLILRKTSND